jgi:hypothetical protein
VIGVVRVVVVTPEKKEEKGPRPHSVRGTRTPSSLASPRETGSGSRG